MPRGPETQNPSLKPQTTLATPYISPYRHPCINSKLWNRMAAVGHQESVSQLRASGSWNAPFRCLGCPGWCRCLRIGSVGSRAGSLTTSMHDRHAPFRHGLQMHKPRLERGFQVYVADTTEKSLGFFVIRIFVWGIVQTKPQRRNAAWLQLYFLFLLLPWAPQAKQ